MTAILVCYTSIAVALSKVLLSIHYAAAASDFASYMSSLPPALRPNLEFQLDWDNDMDRDLREIAHYMVDWDVQLSTSLKLTKEDIADIKEQFQQPEIRR